MVAKLYFYYSAMNAGKSTTLLQSSYNYRERGMHTMLFLPSLIGKETIYSRIGLSAPAVLFDAEFDFLAYVKKYEESCKAGADATPESSSLQPCKCVLVDECQFLSKKQVIQLCTICDTLNIPVLCYGLRSDFQGEPFEGSKYLLTMADVLSEIKTICSCGRKATMNQRVTADGRVVAEGAQVEVGGNERYVGKCRKHFLESLSEVSITTSEASDPEATKTPEKTRAREAKTLEEPAAKKAKTVGKVFFDDETGIAAVSRAQA
eukprot:TRINITY_DN23565_c0_g1_i1.p2 TRINITY_DN23565_c0_g1~~TRINITY_DN23565_c0_g1_i1.p2  ORF type:complete len:263 (-),score=87.72 TRINITY_DN23565_c0_g1_i1:330-1118(-)